MINNRETQCLPKSLNSILIPTISNGVSSALIAFHLIGNNIIMSSFSREANDASSIITTFQSFVIGATFGILSSTAVQLGSALAKKDTQKIEAFIKIAWVSSAGLGIFSSLIFLSTKSLMPLKDKKIASYVSDFFISLAIAPPFYLMSMTNGIIIFQMEKNWQVPMLSAIAYRIPAVIIGYFFAGSMGIAGLGYGATIAAIISASILQLWFLRDIYREYNLQDVFNIPNFKENFNSFISEGWKLALQRLTEWGNLFAISMIIGYLNKNDLASEAPSIQIMLICNLFSQGIAQAAMMLLKPIGTELKYLKENLNSEENISKYVSLGRESYNIFLWSNMGGAISNVLFAVACILCKKTFIDYFMKQDATENSHLYNLADTLILINSLSLIPDAVRQISGGALRGWGDILSPTLANLMIMSGIGIPLGMAAGCLYNSSSPKYTAPLFILRIITIILSAIANCYLFYQHRKNDLAAIPENIDLADNYENTTCIRKFFRFFKPESSVNPDDYKKIANEDGIPLVSIDQNQSRSQINYGALYAFR